MLLFGLANQPPTPALVENGDASANSDANHAADAQDEDSSDVESTPENQKKRSRIESGEPPAIAKAARTERYRDLQIEVPSYDDDGDSDSSSDDESVKETSQRPDTPAPIQMEQADSKPEPVFRKRYVPVSSLERAACSIYIERYGEHATFSEIDKRLLKTDEELDEDYHKIVYLVVLPGVTMKTLTDYLQDLDMRILFLMDGLCDEEIIEEEKKKAVCATVLLGKDWIEQPLDLTGLYPFWFGMRIGVYGSSLEQLNRFAQLIQVEETIDEDKFAHELEKHCKDRYPGASALWQFVENPKYRWRMACFISMGHMIEQNKLTVDAKWINDYITEIYRGWYNDDRDMIRRFEVYGDKIHERIYRGSKCYYKPLPEDIQVTWGAKSTRDSKDIPHPITFSVDESN